MPTTSFFMASINLSKEKKKQLKRKITRIHSYTEVHLGGQCMGFGGVEDRFMNVGRRADTYYKESCGVPFQVDGFWCDPAHLVQGGRSPDKQPLKWHCCLSEQIYFRFGDVPEFTRGRYKYAGKRL